VFDGEQQLRSATVWLSTDRPHCAFAEPRPDAPELSARVQTIAGKHIATELGAVDTTQRDARGLRRAGPIEKQHAASCVSASIMSTAGISGVPGKCPWK
jgi:hypothetical protein